MTEWAWTKEDLEAQARRNPDLAERNPELMTQEQKERRARDLIINKPTKYHSQRTHGYASKKEAEYAEQLVLRKAAGEVWFWLEQVPFKLPGGSVHRVDFMVFYKHNPTAVRNGQWKAWELVEVKGRDLALGKLKRRQVEEIYGVKIKLV